MKVELIDHMGDDLRVANAARVSFAKESDYICCRTGEPIRGCWSEDAPCSGPVLTDKDTKLIHYLAKHGHWSPFSHCFLTFRIKAPIFVARQLQKHQVGLSWNEVSRRYVDTEPEFYVPDRWRLKAENVKQGSSDQELLINETFKKSEGSKNARRTPSAVKYSNWKSRANREGTEFTIEQSDVPWVTHCPILGIELDYALCEGTGIKKNSPTLDRIDNSKGYIPGNVMVISSLANTMKSFATPDELKAFSRSMLVQYAGEFTSGTSSVESYYAEMKDLYKRMVDAGMCAEQARMFMPQSMMTEWYWSGSLYAFARVCKQRLDSHAQKETREVALQIDTICFDKFPVSWEALMHN